MSYCKEFGKDKVIFATKEDHSIPSSITLTPAEPPAGLILPSGEINWNCPCLGGMATGPCGVEFRQAFSCFHYSEAEPKGSDCYDVFKEMQDCFAKYPTVYNKTNVDPTEDLDLDLSGVADQEDTDAAKGIEQSQVDLSKPQSTMPLEKADAPSLKK